MYALNILKTRIQSCVINLLFIGNQSVLRSPTHDIQNDYIVQQNVSMTLYICRFDVEVFAAYFKYRAKAKRGKKGKLDVEENGVSAHAAFKILTEEQVAWIKEFGYSCCIG